MKICNNWRKITITLKVDSPLIDRELYNHIDEVIEGALDKCIDNDHIYNYEEKKIKVGDI